MQQEIPQTNTPEGKPFVQTPIDRRSKTERLVESIMEHLAEHTEKWKIEAEDFGWTWYKLDSSKREGHEDVNQRLRLSQSNFPFKAGVSYYSNKDFDTIHLKLPWRTRIRLWLFLRRYRRDNVLEVRQKRLDRGVDKAMEMLAAN